MMNYDGTRLLDSSLCSASFFMLQNFVPSPVYRQKEVSY